MKKIYYADVYDKDNKFIKRLDVDIVKKDRLIFGTIKKEKIPSEAYNVNFMPEFENSSAEEKG